MSTFDEIDQAIDRALAEGAVVLLHGIPGVGKTMHARRVIERIVLDDHQQRWVEAEFTQLEDGVSRHKRCFVPFRAPHHTVSVAGLVGRDGRAGEVDMAKFGVLFLDELPEFSRVVIGALADRWRVMPATIRPYIIASTNPCPCGLHGWKDRCGCSPENIAKFNERALEFAGMFGVPVQIIEMAATL